MPDIKRSRTRHGERFRASNDLGGVTVQEIVTETDTSSLNKPGTWIQELSEFRRMDKGTPLNSNEARTEFTDPVDGTVYRRRSGPTGQSGVAPEFGGQPAAIEPDKDPTR